MIVLSPCTTTFPSPWDENKWKEFFITMKQGCTSRPAPWGRKKVCPAPKREASPRPALWKLPRPTGQSWFQSIEIQKAITRKDPNYQSIYARFCPASQIFTLAPPAVKKVRPVHPCWPAITQDLKSFRSVWSPMSLVTWSGVGGCGETSGPERSWVDLGWSQRVDCQLVTASPLLNSDQNSCWVTKWVSQSSRSCGRVKKSKHFPKLESKKLQ